MYNYDFDQDAVLRELGLDNSTPEIKTQVIEGIYEQLSTRMRVRIGGLMTDVDYAEFDGVAKKGDAEAGAWLQKRFPDYKDMYMEELEQLVADLKRHADVIVEESKHQQ